MNKKVILNMLGYVIFTEAILLLFPVLTSLIYHDSSLMPLLITVALCGITGLSLVSLKPANYTIYAAEGFVIVAASWIVVSLFGALPFWISGNIPNFIDAFFETVSGFTTTGSSILTDVEALPHGLLFWRSFTHWIGGMGILVFVLAIFSKISSDRSMHVMRAEVPGPLVGKLVPKIKDTAKILYMIYVVLTIIEVVILLLAGMPFFDALVTSFGTAGTGGFGIKSNSIAYYQSPLIEYIVAIFMLLFGINFNMYYFILIKDMKSIFKNEELKWYIGIIIAAVVCITCNVLPMYDSISNAFRDAFFSVSTVITTTGYATADFNLFPTFSKIILFCLMYLGACAGSTGGGFKISRLVIIFKCAKNHLKKLVHPRLVTSVYMDGKPVEENMQREVVLYTVVFVLLAFAGILIISLDGFDFETTITSVAACIGNIGPGLGMVGPSGNFSMFSNLSKIVLSFLMLLGRLELFPILIFMNPLNYKKGNSHM